MGLIMSKELSSSSMQGMEQVDRYRQSEAVTEQSQIVHPFNVENLLPRKKHSDKDALFSLLSAEFELEVNVSEACSSCYGGGGHCELEQNGEFQCDIAKKDCNTGYGCFYTKPSVSLKTQNRKVLAGLEEKRESVKVGLQGSPTSVKGGSFVGYELRNVPSGPDPLHHNRASPEKPRTP
ncbi:hypothetical protein CFP56_001499 [Quercus suber]|uniref:Wall-associated receptor kinase C-terminal domain-containing protein n=1 Tax=Quercus suber TaxID=58331 RepID=A0AAW0LH16_QUESU